MKNLEIKKCKWPKCQKEVYDEKMLFCGEHEKIGKSWLKKGVKSVVGVVGAGILYQIKKKN
ncbi:hypothetical protein [Streptococcus oricebi]|uniref:Uncharacterized protein n=1 Tax=Streptococcus oricebi TaxID=1547447 RepID=A0ABS5B528_9STRE|nr:hypothetical protein [Streptococcus oricebi]MBP2623089.1 hypothetical protein [Streptococcus oricebi]